MGSGKGSSQQQPTQTTSNVNQSSLPAYAQPYFQSLMSRAEAVSQEPYQAYTGERLAPFTDPQKQSFETVQQNVGSYLPNFNAAESAFTRAAGFQPQDVTNSYSATNYNPNLWTDFNISQSYMSPYMQNVVDIEKRKATQDYNLQNQRRNAQAQQAGAFGGSRQGIVQGLADQNYNQQLQDIQNQGLQSAYTTGLGAFNQDRSALLGANQLNNQFRQQQAQLQMAAQGANNQYGLQAGQLGLGAGQGIAGLGQARQAAGLTEANALSNVGAIQQAQNQQALDIAYQDFLNQRDYDRQNLNWMSSILHGVPVSANSNVTSYQAPPSAISQIAGLGVGGIGLAKLFGG